MSLRPNLVGRLLPLCLILLLAQGCSSTQKVSTVDKLDNTKGHSKVLLMPIDVELSILTATGLTEPQAEWTENASVHMLEAIETNLKTNDIKMELYQSVSDSPASTELQLERLHQYVGNNVLVHHYGPLQLPSKNKQFDWTLGEQARELKNNTDADYALFVFVRDSYASAGRVAMQVGMALLGVGVAGGTQVGFASLVDLNNGDIVWFNRLVSTTGDLRELEDAKETVNNLLDTLPKA